MSAAAPGTTTTSLATGLLVSDVDSTFLTQEVIELVADHAGVRAEVEEITTAAMRGELDFAASLRARVALLEGLDDSVLAEVRADRGILRGRGHERPQQHTALRLLEDRQDAAARSPRRRRGLRCRARRSPRG